ncbi:hypothetical protein B0H10DRAFT_1994682 [Mycena sp. CBHHK59/15]|nr:hypothetical protein B0H10DRAFT_1994682 [Mycena sp. CBHHK59/15]
MAESTFQAAQLAALTEAFKELFATTFIGFCVATTLYGISVLQVYLYFRNYSNDRWALKTMVATLWTFDTLTTIFVAHSLFLFVLGFVNRKIDLNIPWSFTSEKLLVTLITFIAQCFYAHTIWKVSTNKIATTFISVLAVGSFGQVALNFPHTPADFLIPGLGIVTTVHLFQNTTLNSISTPKFLIISGLVQGLAALNDIVITGTLSYYLHTRRSKLPSSEKLIDTLIVYAVSRGVLTAIVQILFLVLNVALTHRTLWLPFHMAVGKLYVNSVLATLNVRQNLSQQSEIQLGAGVSLIGGQDAEMDERHIRTKPITFVVVRGPESSMGTVSRGTGDGALGEQG